MYITCYFIEVYVQCSYTVHMYVQFYICTYKQYVLYYVHAYVIPVVPSVTQAVATLVTPNDNITEHSIIVTCTVRPDSNADMCVVMAMAVGRTTREGT